MRIVINGRNYEQPAGWEHGGIGVTTTNGASFAVCWIKGKTEIYQNYSYNINGKAACIFDLYVVAAYPLQEDVAKTIMSLSNAVRIDEEGKVTEVGKCKLKINNTEF